ncbi:hypothetical protein EMIHUDRAFT_245211 [Emiliania huxleyi CCMP1516]|uniref:Short-chain dehydrogenase n=2 Tax=Emiliania huxleyi TaxID=2903 RepID=A0A0D3IY69_EMIH1|nr:hypothetical protein EMIHUDRAFT_245211 [Emiliania huxleyi CCMP1516]EOD16204.1 hypothetical protein EMIHUDRAFT_245211 [Emiliania huxleyi CCMP1516]|eukprot:XP_005768633.1 hypothetical protein EMIHUDRAFT_245211 [Emiliania huxleyi CCMP1516]
MAMAANILPTPAAAFCLNVNAQAMPSALQGLKLGAKNPISMAYKDSKLCLAMLSHTLHQNYHKQTGIAFSTVYPGGD